MPSLQTLRNDRSIQDQIQDRLRELSGIDKKGTEQKIKSQKGGSVDIFVKERVKWPHEYVLDGNTKDRITYEKLNHSFPVNILGNLISPVDAVRNLGVWFDSDFSFSCHVMKVCKACFASVRDLKRL